MTILVAVDDLAVGMRVRRDLNSDWPNQKALIRGREIRREARPRLPGDRRGRPSDRAGRGRDRPFRLNRMRFTAFLAMFGGRRSNLRGGDRLRVRRPSWNNASRAYTLPAPARRVPRRHHQTAIARPDLSVRSCRPTPEPIRRRPQGPSPGWPGVGPGTALRAERPAEEGEPCRSAAERR